jgi:macrolide-specific efflux system membrane fusion protein
MNKKYLILAALFLTVACGAIWYFFFKTKSVEYREAEIKKAGITLKVLATGSVLPENRLQIKSSISGRAEKIFVREGDKVHKGQVLAQISSTERAVMLDSARAQGSEEVQKWEEIYKPTPIIAPLAGMIISRSIEPGQTFTTGDAIFVMADRLTIKAQVDETDLSQIRVGQKAKITLDAYLEKDFDAKVEHVAYEAKTVNNVTTYLIDVLPVEKIEFLRSGMTANVTFFGETKENILVIENQFIKYENGKPLTQVKVDGKPENRELKLGITDGRKTEVLSGLEEGSTVMLTINKDSKIKSNMLSGPRRR